VYSLNYATSGIFFISGTQPTANFTVNITNIPNSLASNQFTIVLLYQAAYYANNVSATSVNSTSIVSAAAPKYAGSVTPTLSASALFIQTFTVVQCFSTKYVITNVTPFN
jgi:hypothetical protein